MAKPRKAVYGPPGAAQGILPTIALEPLPFDLAKPRLRRRASPAPIVTNPQPIKRPEAIGRHCKCGASKVYVVHPSGFETINEYHCLVCWRVWR